MQNAFQSLKAGTLLAPVPAVMVSCALPGERPNLITLAWVGTVNSDPPMCSISVRPSRYSHRIIRESGEFIINLCGEENLKATDFCGVKSGREVDKFAACGLTPLAVEGFAAPAVAECPAYLACRVTSVQPLGSHDLFLGQIQRVGVKKELMGEDGSIDFGKAKLVAYNHGVYYPLGQALGFFGYSVAAPDVLARRMEKLK
ncbi:MAG: flavin reductase family protein [Clostridiales bacterium]|nr:flavin reductase family protein [Clostridiales bacterium]